MAQNNLITQFVDRVSSWDDIKANPHRFGGTEFNFGKVEIGHVHHHNGMVDIPFTVKIREALVDEGLASLHHLLKDSGWITFFIQDENTLEQAIWLMRLSYLQKTARRRGIDMTEIETINLSDTVKKATFPHLA